MQRVKQRVAAYLESTIACSWDVYRPVIGRVNRYSNGLSKAAFGMFLQTCKDARKLTLPPLLLPTPSKSHCPHQ